MKSYYIKSPYREIGINKININTIGVTKRKKEKKMSIFVKGFYKKHISNGLFPKELKLGINSRKQQNENR